MKRHYLVIAVIVIVIVGGAGTGYLDAQEIEILDLAALVPGSEVEQTVPPGAVLRVKVLNRVPKHAYTLRASVETIPIVKLDFSAPTTRAADRTCDAVIEALLNGLLAAETEPAVATLVQNARNDAASLCNEEQRKFLEQHIEEKTTHSFRAVVLSSGERLVVQVTRVEGDKALTWKVIYTTGPRGRWMTAYGVGFLPEKDEEFFTESIGNDQYEIRRKEPSGGLDFVPAIFFTWLPRKWENRSWAFSPAGGLGFDVSNPVVFAGGSAMFNQNLSFLVGVVLNKQTQLDGQYEEGQILGEALTPDQLVVAPYRANFFFSVAFRFGGNPFGSGE
jgi:hypothetical protein